MASLAGAAAVVDNGGTVEMMEESKNDPLLGENSTMLEPKADENNLETDLPAGISKKEARKRKFLRTKKLLKKEPELKDKRLKKRILSVLGTKDGAVMLLHELLPKLEYRVTNQEGPIHSPVFTMEARFDDQIFSGEGSTKRRARCETADKVLKHYVTLMNWSESDLEQLQQLSSPSFSSSSSQTTASLVTTH